MDPAGRSTDEENRRPADSRPFDQSDPNSQNTSSPILSDLSSATVQADIARAAREMLTFFFFFAVLMDQPTADRDFRLGLVVTVEMKTTETSGLLPKILVTELVSNLSIGGAHPTGDFDPVEPFQHSLSLVDRALVQSANMNAPGPSSPTLSPPLSTEQLHWAHPAPLDPPLTLAVDRLGNCFPQNCSLFKNLPYTPLPSLPQDRRLFIPGPAGPAHAHASTFQTLAPSPLSHSLPSSSGPLHGNSDPVEIKSHLGAVNGLTRPIH
ncbi:hypothetical protein VP01_429g1 [Puccinia sorghi]|uniref:Uncharacterized protein n=1 Tax=Puccinia sorghi TaxID=27349 RepID=A0A0L6UR02_9BASI|nr:hypothetical protein VP01_429g1 [Puccinia sorghi]